MDQKLLFLINREWTNPFLDRTMLLLSSFDLWFWPMLILGLLVVVRGGFRARAFVLVVCSMPPNMLAAKLLFGVLALLFVTYVAIVRARFSGPKVDLATLERSE